MFWVTHYKLFMMLELIRSQRVETKKKEVENAQEKLHKLEETLKGLRNSCSALPSEASEVSGYDKKVKTLENRRSRQKEKVASMQKSIETNKSTVNEMRCEKAKLCAVAQILKRDCKMAHQDEKDMSERATELQIENEQKRTAIALLKRTIHEERINHALEMSILEQIITSNGKKQEQIVANLLREHRENNQVGNMSVLEETATRKKMIANSWKIAKQSIDLHYTHSRLKDLKSAFDLIKVGSSYY
jgi:hypothetical protein